jgi:RNA polymerase sigma factor (sigma-70 family)
MPNSPRHAILDYLHALEETSLQDLPDGALLECFVAQREQAALLALLQRHGPLVWSVCRRVLREEHSAEDAFQATFLVLVRKAGSVRKAESIRSWLYGVANRVARRARAQQVARREREKAQPPRSPDLPSGGPEWDELRAILDEEVQRLPEKYRLPVMLCHLQGQSTTEVARELGCPAATVATRLARAREQLRGRLSRRGLAPSASAFAAWLAQQSLLPLPAGLLATTARVGAAYMTGSVAAIAPPIATLTTETLRAMFLDKLKPALAVLLALFFLGGGLGLLASRGPGAPLPEKGPAATAPKPPAKGKLAELLKKRLKMAQDEYEARNQEFLAGRGTLDILHGASLRLRKAQLETARTKAERLAAHRGQIKRAAEIADFVKEYYDAGRMKAADHFQSEFYRLEAEIDYERERSK